MINISVSALSAAVLKSEYKTEIIKVTRGEVLHQYLQFSNITSSKKEELKNERNLLRRQLTFEVNTRMFKFLSAKKRQYKIGVHLHKIHLRKANDFVEVAGNFGSNRMASLKMFMEQYGVTEDDFGLESLYKNWQRFEEKKIKKCCRKNITSVLNCTLLGATGKFPLFWERIVSVLSYYYSVGTENILKRDFEIKTVCGTFLRKFEKNHSIQFSKVRYILFFLMQKHSKMMHKEIAEILKMSRRTVSHGIQKIQSELTYYEDLQIEIAEIEAILKV